MKGVFSVRMAWIAQAVAMVVAGLVLSLGCSNNGSELMTITPSPGLEVPEAVATVEGTEVIPLSFS